MQLGILTLTHTSICTAQYKALTKQRRISWNTSRERPAQYQYTAHRSKQSKWDREAAAESSGERSINSSNIIREKIAHRIIRKRKAIARQQVCKLQSKVHLITMLYIAGIQVVGMQGQCGANARSASTQAQPTSQLLSRHASE